MKLYEAESPNALRVWIFMAEKGIEIPRVPVDIFKGGNLEPAYLAMNPMGRVPVLELDDGTYLSESVAICRYLEGVQPEPNLFGTDALEMARIEMWNRRAEFNFFANVAMAFRNLTGIFKDRETCVAEWGKVAAAEARIKAAEERRARKLSIALGAAITIALLVGGEALLGYARSSDHGDHHGFAFESWPGFFSIYGFVACVALVLAAKELRKLLMRSETYYENGDGDGH